MISVSILCRSDVRCSYLGAKAGNERGRDKQFAIDAPKFKGNRDIGIEEGRKEATNKANNSMHHMHIDHGNQVLQLQ
ncbi:MAG: hypothetical protein LBV62_02685 [Rickettsiales bacterium]|jgi:hypothetical protein|nr:hypothetical protein [Rickettsiales bacterium]